MFTIIKNWLETHSMRSDAGLARKARREMRWLGRDYVKELALAHKIEEANAHGEHHEMIESYHAYRKILLTEFSHIQYVVTEYKTFMRRAIEALERLEQDVKMNAHETNKEQILREITQMEREILDGFKTFIGGLASFQNTTYSAKRLLDRASQAREAENELREVRGIVRVWHKLYENADRPERKGQSLTPDEQRKMYLLAHQAITNGIKRHLEALQGALIIGQELQKSAQEQRQKIQELVDRQGLPKAWSQEEAHDLDEFEQELTHWLTAELDAGRIFLSQLERAAA